MNIGGKKNLLPEVYFGSNVEEMDKTWQWTPWEAFLCTQALKRDCGLHDHVPSSAC